MFKKRLFSILLCLFVALQFVYIPAIKVQAATGPQISYTTTGDTTVGSTFNINVNLANATDVYGASVDFAYDPTLIQIVSVDKGDFWTDSNATVAPVDSTSNVAKIGVMLTGNINGITKASGTIVTIKAKVLKAGTINLKTTSDNSAFSQTGNNVLVKLSNSGVGNIAYTGIDNSVSLVKPIESLTAG
ncbi:cohesin domain-containing protein, partial [Clostridium zeae]|uniref:cohesin domain-containing protein n=1 Tax=Clostridium zeae TaxID=2759022 RepID=UPI001E2D21AE